MWLNFLGNIWGNWEYTKKGLKKFFVRTIAFNFGVCIKAKTCASQAVRWLACIRAFVYAGDTSTCVLLCDCVTVTRRRLYTPVYGQRVSATDHSPLPTEDLPFRGAWTQYRVQVQEVRAGRFIA
jgi:hypothetical protein